MSLNLSSDPNNKKSCATKTEAAKDIASRLISELKSKDFQVCGSALAEIYNRLYEGKKELLDELLKNDITELLILRLKENENTNVRFDVVRIILIVLSLSPREVTKLLKESVILEFIKMMDDSSDRLAEQSVLTLSKIIGFGNDAREYVLQYDLLSTVSKLISLHSSNKEILFALGRLIYNVCYNKNSSLDLKYVSTIIPILSSIIDYQEDLDIYNDSKAILFLVQSSLKHLDRVVQGGIIQKILPLLGKDYSTSILILKICDAIASESPQKIQFLLDLNLFKFLKPFISSEDPSTRSSLYLLLSKIANGSHDQSMTLFSLNIFPKIINHLKADELSLQIEALLVISNVLRSSNQNKAQIFINKNLIFPMKRLLEYSDISRQTVVLEVLVKLLKLYPNRKQQNNICEIIKKACLIEHIKTLSKCENETLCKLIQYVLKSYESFESFKKTNSLWNIFTFKK